VTWLFFYNHQGTIPQTLWFVEENMLLVYCKKKKNHIIPKSKYFFIIQKIQNLLPNQIIIYFIPINTQLISL